jgi:hypothetical protein
MSFFCRALFSLLPFFLLPLTAGTGRAQTDFLFPASPQLRIIYAGETKGFLYPCAT